MDNMKRNKLIRKQLEESFNKFKDIKHLATPQKGWIRAIREALGMKGRQLGKRLNVTRQGIAALENNEVNGSVTIKTMRAAAEALDCVFVYGIIPKKTLEQTIRNRAEIIVKKKMAISNQTMFLENQQLSKKEIEEMIHAQIENIVSILPKSLWDDA